VVSLNDHLHVARAQYIFYQTLGQFNSGIGIAFSNGIDKFGIGIEVCYKQI